MRQHRMQPLLEQRLVRQHALANHARYIAVAAGVDVYRKCRKALSCGRDQRLKEIWGDEATAYEG